MLSCCRKHWSLLVNNAEAGALGYCKAQLKVGVTGHFLSLQLAEQTLNPSFLS